VKNFRCISTNCLHVLYCCYFEGGTQKIKQFILYDYTEPTQDKDVELNNKMYIVDGSFFLHRVIWHINRTFEQICHLYKFYVEKHFGINVLIAFDKYNENLRITKNAEYNRCAKNISANILLNEQMNVQMAFLSN
jgi:hypothetical protein